MRLKVITLHGCNNVVDHHKRDKRRNKIRNKTELNLILTSNIHFLVAISSFQPSLIPTARDVKKFRAGPDPRLGSAQTFLASRTSVEAHAG